MAMFQIGERQIQLNEPYVVAPILSGKHEGKWGIFTTDSKSDSGFWLQEARPSKIGAVERARELAPSVGDPIGVVVLTKELNFQRFIPKSRSWNAYTRVFQEAYRRDTKYGGQ